MKKRLFALALASLLLMGMLAACGGSSSSTAGSAPAGSSAAASTAGGASADSNDDGIVYRIGVVEFSGSETASTRAIRNAQNTIAEAAGVEVVRAQLGGYDDESFMTAYESLVSQGVDAVSCVTLSETVLPLLKDLFEENDVKFFLTNRKLSTAEMEDMLLTSPMCLGNDHCGETQNAYDMVKYLSETYDIKNLAAIGLTKGDINGDYRDAGIEQACADLGINLLTTTRGIATTEDVTKSVEGLIASYPEMDSIFIVGGLITSGALAGANQALVNHNKQNDIVIGMVDISTGMQEYMDDGPLKLVAGGNLICDSMFSLVAIANALKGTPLNGDDISIITVNMFWITDSESAANYDKYIEGDVPPFTTEESNEMLFKWKDESVTLESVQAIAGDFSIESVMERHADLF